MGRKRIDPEAESEAIMKAMAIAGARVLRETGADENLSERTVAEMVFRAMATAFNSSRARKKVERCIASIILDEARAQRKAAEERRLEEHSQRMAATAKWLEDVPQDDPEARRESRAAAIRRRKVV